MTTPSTIENLQPTLVGPGHLILVVGPSGAGKDTLIGLAQAACAGDSGIVFAQRVVTREASSYENNIAVVPAIFAQMLMEGDFALHWQAHGLSYGLSRSIADDIRAGRVVVTNVSRTVVATARLMFSRVTVVLVTVPADVLAARLAARGRASDGKPDARLARSVDAVAADVTINNVGRAKDHCAELLRVISNGRESVPRDVTST